MTHAWHGRPGRASQVLGTVPRAARGGSRRRRAPLAPRTSPSAIRLAFAPSSLCPHCGRDSKTVQGVCADCWGSKGGRQFRARDDAQGWPPALSPTLVGALLAVLPITILVLLWILA